MKKHNLTLTQLQWYMVIECLDVAGDKFVATKRIVKNYGKHRAHGRKCKALADSLRKKLKGKL